MTKEEKIKEAWGELYESLKEFIDENGFYNGDCTLLNDSFFHETFTVNLEKEFSNRPKSLKNIENNNGWIKIDSKKDLPKSDQIHYLVFSKNEIKKSSFNVHQVEAGYQFGEITHYKPIIVDKPPIY